MILFTLEHILTHISLSIVSIVITIYLMNLLVHEIVGLYDSSEKGMVTVFLCITGLLVIRWIYSRHLPLSDVYESLMFLSWSFYIIHMIPYFRNHKNHLNEITARSAIFTQGFATSGLLTEMHQSTILVPALQSQWLMMHVSMMILNYAALLNHLQMGAFSFVKFKYANEISNALKWKNNNLISFRNKNYHRYQLIQQLDCWSSRVISLGFLFLTVGILSGAVWANEAWGSYWNWDPKETWAFITWTTFAIYLHTRTTENLQGSNSAIVASMGFFIIWICYFGVNLLGIGLHSYGSFALTSN
ncbi:hypothetical protein AQUCO_06400044v1 [Aquilegia coerulea]|uniref:Cytochrome c assembly protein domain-containing protein n=1 Tax=Aquilegia coerulea TaxID=218851 RepID=A0A2G5CCN5_AQUCA|nr:hypothetical protein AQUCO_06400044v1 [Aquilegia coerulea]